MNEGEDREDVESEGEKDKESRTKGKRREMEVTREREEGLSQYLRRLKSNKKERKRRGMRMAPFCPANVKGYHRGKHAQEKQKLKNNDEPPSRLVTVNKQQQQQAKQAPCSPNVPCIFLGFLSISGSFRQRHCDEG